MKLFSISSTCAVLCLATVLTGCDSDTSDQWAAHTVQLKNAELSAQIKDMKATIRRAKQLQLSAEQITQMNAEAATRYQVVVEQLMTAIDRNIQIRTEYSALSLREQELQDMNKDLHNTYQQMLDEVNR